MTLEESIQRVKDLRDSLKPLFDALKKGGALYEFLVRLVEEAKEGKGLVFVDEKLLEWLDKQVEAGKYDSRSHAIESLIQKEMKREEMQKRSELCH